MLSLLKKELNSFFGSITGYLVICIFLLATSLFLWIIPGNFNIIDGQRATLKGLFDLAPWLFLFLIPAITMKMFAEEKKTGTMEMIVTRPLTSWSIVSSKFLASFILVIVSILPSLFYFYSVHYLGNPVGSIDVGATWGSYLGLLLLAAVYIAIGLFASIITSNQIVSFLIAIALSFIMFLGFDFIATTVFSGSLQNFFLKISIHQHYISISRGVVDSRDLLYFIATTLFFAYFTRQLVLKQKLLKRFTLRNIAVIVLFWVLAVWLINERFFRIDLTWEKRYTISDITKQLLKEQNQALTFEIYLAGKLPAGMKEFQEAIIEKIEDLNAWSGKNISSELHDVYAISNEHERNNVIQNLINVGIEPINVQHKTTEGLSTMQMYPGVIIKGYKKAIAINLLKSNPYLSDEENFQQSMELLEFEFAKAIRYLKQSEQPAVMFLNGQAEASEYETADIRYTLSENYRILDGTADDLFKNDTVKIAVVAAPTGEFSEHDKLLIDQFIMRGGKVLWCVDPVNVSIDSLSTGLSTLAFEKGLNLRDLLFNYGVRLNSNLVQDAFCLDYKVNTAPAGQSSRYSLAPFYYSPKALPNPNHKISRNLNNVMLEFASSIELVGDQTNTTGAVILATSPYARSVQTPVEVSLLSALNPPDKRLFNVPNIPIGVLLEGNFKSAFKNRMTQQLGLQNITETSVPNKMIVIADGDIIKNKIRNQGGNIQVMPLGSNVYTGEIFGNREFLMNCIDYLADDVGLMELRTKVIKLRLLDKVKLRDEKLKWQLMNTLIPVGIFLVFGLIFNYIRRRKYSS